MYRPPPSNSAESDVCVEWVAGDTSSIAEWDYGTTSSIAYHKVWRQKQLEFSEESDQASWVSAAHRPKNDSSSRAIQIMTANESAVI